MLDRATLAALFEGAPRFLARLAAAGPFAIDDALFAAARAIAHAMPEAEQVELVDAHPRLGAPPASVSAMSYVEQGYDRARGHGRRRRERGRRRRRRARPAQRRVRGALRVPLLRLRRRPTARGAAPRHGRRARRRPRRPSSTARSTPSSTSPSTAMEADRGHDDRARAEPLRQGRHPARPRRPRTRRRIDSAT